MEKQFELKNPSMDSMEKLGTFRTSGAYLEFLRLTRLVNGRRLSIKRLASLAQMGTTTYENVKRA